MKEIKTNDRSIEHVPEDNLFYLPFPLAVEIKVQDNKFHPVEITTYMGNAIWRGCDQDGKTIYASWDQIYPVE